MGIGRAATLYGAYIKPDAIVPDHQVQLCSALSQFHPDLSGLGMPHDIRERCLRNAKTGGLKFRRETDCKRARDNLHP
jgi:hypothetical protein